MTSTSERPGKDAVLCYTFIEVVGAHGVSNHCWKVVKLRGALQQLIGYSLIQLCAPSDNFTQNHLFKLGTEGVVHCFICDHHCPWSQTWRRVILHIRKVKIASQITNYTWMKFRACKNGSYQLHQMFPGETRLHHGTEHGAVV